MSEPRTYKVAAVLSSRGWPADGEPSTIYYDFRAEGVEETCNIGRKPTNPLRVGDEILATAETDSYGKLRLKRVQQNGGFGGGGRGMSPADQKRITRLACQERAIRLARLAHDVGCLPKVGSVNELFKVVTGLADALVKDAEQ